MKKKLLLEQRSFLSFYDDSRLLKSVIVFFFFAFLNISSPRLNAQPTNNSRQYLIKGQVVDSTNGQPLEGVTVAVDGKRNKTSTDKTGNFNLSLSGSNNALIFTSVGFGSLRIPVSGEQLSLQVVMHHVTSSLDEVVVVGYGTQKRSTLTGAVSTLKGNEVAETPVANVSNSLAGKLTGVSMRPNGGQPGMDNPDIHTGVLVPQEIMRHW
jgi:hypothetical protein